MSYPSNCETPIAARLLLADSRRTPIRAELDFRQRGPQNWDIDIETNDGRLSLSMGGSVMRVNDKLVVTPDSQEYRKLYAHFAALVRDRRIDVDLAPFQLVADALLCGRHVTVEPFDEG